MQKKPDKSRRKEVLRSLAEQGQKRANEEKPISLLDLGDLFDHLDARLSVGMQPHSRRNRKRS